MHLSDDAAKEPAVEECRLLVERIVRERNERNRRKLGKELGKWNEDQVLDVLMEMQAETQDPAVLMRLVKLQEGLLSPAASEGGGGKGGVDGGSKSLEEVRAELASMERGFESEEEEEKAEAEPARKRRKGEEVPEKKGGMESQESASKGWAIWEGPWVPKPIGVV